MPVKKINTETNASFFITFTCIEWLPLIQTSNTYNAFYKWFEYLKNNNISIIAYVIMPNHFHGIFFIPDNYDKTINQVIANGKRFIAYEIIKQLKILNQESLLDSLAKKTSIKERLRGKIHKVFISSFDCKLIYNEKMMETKIDYIHHNPVKGKWALVEDYTDYIHSSIAFYEKGENIDFIIHYKDV